MPQHSPVHSKMQSNAGKATQNLYGTIIFLFALDLRLPFNQTTRINQSVMLNKKMLRTARILES